MTNGRSSKKYDVIVIGAGHNGLTTAAFLAGRGRKVIVLEQRDVLGGLACSEEFHPGYRSPGVLHDTSSVRHGLIKSLNLASHGLSLDPEPPAIHAPVKDGNGLSLHHDAQKAAREIAKHSEHDAERYSEYRAFVDRVRGFVNGVFDESPPGLGTIDARTFWPVMKKGLGFRRLGKHDAVELFRIIPMSLADWLDEWFETDRLKTLLAAPAIRGAFVGPRSPGSAINLLLWECRKGPSVKGGPGALVTALEAAAGGAGAKIRTSARVKEIGISEGKVTGVTLDDGETIDGAVVAASVDPKTIFLKLLPVAAITEKFAQRIANYRAKGTTAKVDIALRQKIEVGGNAGSSVEYVRTGENLTQVEKAFDAVKYRLCSSTPVLDVCIPSASNRDFAPDGGSSLSVLVQYAPYDLEDGWGDRQRELLGQRVVETLADNIPGVKESVVGLRVLTPADLESHYGTSGGHPYHGDHAVDQLFVRPSPECARHTTPIGGLFLCGSGSFPGGGITCAPGALGARAILKHS
ncbi:MAG: NAD(P)/FAD-dependent oxidoreductase [Candidatus Latescibacterota bacterium]|nr:MAG: NAD(P)/FAD-dependent oxidoreductase [Candidatus Latescibacterota bacterium]